ncbi:hypothetical protein [Flagellimonas lutaonensis]|uniref:Uncharacterized protein n=1 Tax=Flagellimonas lutaonensis TaxID=516051 RepID=A0A0D5YQT3_9FLAO|nr:hypothetical protein [Allomuricauda lutaonensis]AKA34284.1 hypothetical protein VC82_614 [Allomuricauda lutaonensis]
MNPKKTIIWLGILIVVLSLIATIGPLLIMDKGEFYGFMTLRGEEVLIFGEGLYKFDSVFAASGFKGQDFVTLFLGIPLLSIALFYYKKGSLKAGLLLLGVISFFLYVYASMSLGAAYNGLFMVYVLLFSASLFFLIVLFVNTGLEILPAEILKALPRTFPAYYLFLCGVVTLVVWSVPLVSSAMQGAPPDLLDHYTTMVTDALDLAIITPSTFLAGWLILKRNPLGYQMAFSLIGIIVFLLPIIALSTYIQFVNGISYSTGEVIGPISGFLVLGLLGIGVLWSILRKLPKEIFS